MKKNEKKSSLSRNTSAISHFFRIPDISNIIDRQRMFVLIFFSSYGFISGISYLLFNLFVPQNLFIVIVNVIHIIVIPLLVVLYLRKLVSLYHSVIFLILFSQLEIFIVMLCMAQAEGEMMGIRGILSNVTLLSILLLLSMAAYIRYLPYIQTLLAVIVLCICAYILKDTTLWQLTPSFGLVFIVLSVLGDRLVRGVKSLQSSKDSLDKEQNKIFEFLNMNKEELFKLIHLTQRKKLSDKQKNKLLELLDEHTKNSVLEVAAEVVEQKKRNLSLLNNRELGLTPYEKEVCLLILKEMTVADIARKLNKTSTSITSMRASIRNKLKLQKEENLYEALKRIVSLE